MHTFQQVDHSLSQNTRTMVLRIHSFDSFLDLPA